MIDTQRGMRASAALRVLRQARGLTQQDLAFRAGLSQREIQRLEAGTVRPTIATIRRLAHAIDVEYRDLLNLLSVP